MALTVSGLPSGVTASFSPASTTGNSATLTLNASATATLGAATLTITGTSGTLTHTSAVSLTVTGGGGGTVTVTPVVSTNSPWFNELQVRLNLDIADCTVSDDRCSAHHGYERERPVQHRGWPGHAEQQQHRFRTHVSVHAGIGIGRPVEQHDVCRADRRQRHGASDQWRYLQRDLHGWRPDVHTNRNVLTFDTHLPDSRDAVRYFTVVPITLRPSHRTNSCASPLGEAAKR